jgi:hypothetical protein
MFKINSYLQFRDTPDGKPRVLRQGLDYDYSGGEKGEVQGLFEEIEGGLLMVAELKDCRPLLSVKNSLPDSEWWTEGDIAIHQGQLKIVYMIEENGVYKMVGRKSSEMWDDTDEGFLYDAENLGSFFADPVKYSKLLWDCTEEEGWKKIFQLLNLLNK